ncbi:DUF5807 family protein [Halorubellus salinus]|uniref:DUF5807 family protein n=1 Tax=Halorubellus salinus TaxID=755309 RepID=UPI001D0922F3|nr:DUF5807 family protein [Halorubellus salinus]
MTDVSARREAFLAGDQPDDVAIYLADDYVDDLGRLEKYGVRTAEGIVIVVDGESGRNAFHAATGMDAMNFAQGAMGTESEIGHDLTTGECPDAENDPDTDHVVQFVFAFSEDEKDDDEFDGLYTEGDVVHAYAHCACGASYSDKWLAAED